MNGKPWLKYYTEQAVELTGTPLADQFRDWVERQPQKTFIIENTRQYSYAQVNTEACRLANALSALGVCRGDIVALALPNQAEFVVCAHACLKLGAVMAPINPRFTVREISRQYAWCGIRTAICPAENLAAHLEVALCAGVELGRIITVRRSSAQPAAHAGSLVHDYHSLLAGAECADTGNTADLDDVHLVMHTCGTTGFAKGCGITGRNLIAVANALTNMYRFDTWEEYRVLSATPLYHIYGFQTVVNMNILLGGSVIFLPKINPAALLEAMRRCCPTAWFAVPTLIAELIGQEELASAFKSLRYIGCGAFPLSAAQLSEFEAAAQVEIFEGYGASETSMAVLSNPPARRKVGSVGIPIAGVDVKIIDLDSGSELTAAKSAGELCFRGRQVISEYWRSPAESALAFCEGWWHSGDIGYMDEDGFVFLFDRKKDYINCSGFKVFCNEVDEIITTHPSVREAAVAGAPAPKRGETVKAYVVLRPGRTLTLPELREHCRQALAAYKLPTQLEFLAELPRTSLGKIDRKALRDKAKS
jgi:long-chain acyl-CoA synthetase